MPRFRASLFVALAALLSLSPRAVAGQDSVITPAPSAPRAPLDPRIERLKAEAATKVEARAKLIQEIIDQVYSYGELGMQEFETSRYLTGILEKNGFTVTRNIAGMPTGWVARWATASR